MQVRLVVGAPQLRAGGDRDHEERPRRRGGEKPREEVEVVVDVLEDVGEQEEPRLAREGAEVPGRLSLHEADRREPRARERDRVPRRVDPDAAVVARERGEVRSGPAPDVDDDRSRIGREDARDERAQDPAPAGEPPVPVLERGVQAQLLGLHLSA